MADKKISDFTATTSVASGDLLEIETAGGNSRKVTAANLDASLRVLGVRGALVTKASDQTTANYSAGVTITWDTETYDTDAIHSTVTNTSRLTVPTGVTYVRLRANVELDLVTAGSDIFIQVQKNGSAAFVGVPKISIDLPSIGAPQGNLSSGTLAVTAGDYFELLLSCADTSITVKATSSWFEMEIVA